VSSEGLQLTWQNFEANYLGGPPREVLLPGKSKVRLFVAVESGIFGMRVPVKLGTQIPSSPIRGIGIQETRIGGAPAAEIRCVLGAGTKEFFYFLLAIADGLQLKDLTFEDAFEEAVGAWRELLRDLARMSEEAELGLLGELFTLEFLIGTLGPTALGHWTGPTTDKHDFRVGRNEFEVKTTVGSERIHVINGLNQLAPSLDCRLYLVSWQMARAGPEFGGTLVEKIEDVRRSLKRHPRAVSRFEELIEKGTAWRAADAYLYTERWRPRSTPQVVPVNVDCPRITTKVLALGLEVKLTALITDVHYRINLEGRGFPLNIRALKRILGGSTRP